MVLFERKSFQHNPPLKYSFVVTTSGKHERIVFGKPHISDMGRVALTRNSHGLRR
jgi:hypothetical protein